MAVPECHFELKELRCDECGAPTGEQGTCEDIAYCARCRAEWADITGRDNVAGQWTVQSIEGHKFRPRARAVHFSSNGKTLCGRKGSHPVSAERDEVTCKRCLSTASTIGLAG
jgi:Zn finger protein HypA/HybF involved in hydrogenase expression